MHKWETHQLQEGETPSNRLDLRSTYELVMKHTEQLRQTVHTGVEKITCIYQVSKQSVS